MRIYESSEDYLERILVLQKKLGTVRSIDIATDMNYSKASISRAIKKLREEGLIIVGSGGNIILTDEGLMLANHIYERHTILTEFFVSLGVSQEIAAKDACKIEHDLSDESFTALKKYLNK